MTFADLWPTHDPEECMRRVGRCIQAALDDLDGDEAAERQVWCAGVGVMQFTVNVRPTEVVVLWPEDEEFLRMGPGVFTDPPAPFEGISRW